MNTPQEEPLKTAPKLLVTVVERGRGGRVVALTKAAGAPGGTIILGRGTAPNTVLQVLGLGGSERELVYTLAPAPLVETLVAAIADEAAGRKKFRGVAFVLDVPAVLRPSLSPSAATPRPAPEPPSGETMHTHTLISVIVNRGYADDIMHAARKAGARGGTVINARGTGTGEDAKFFGVTIVPEKEFLLILAERDEAPLTLEAVRSSPCLAQPGMGIAFCTPVERFVPLGGK